MIVIKSQEKARTLGKIGKPRTSKGLAAFCAKIADEKLGTDILILDLSAIEGAPSDYFVICSCDSDVQIRAITEAVKTKCRELDMKLPRHEGTAESEWALLDFFDVVMHVMHKKTRDYYKLEKLWGDAVFSQITDTGTVAKVPRAALKQLYADSNSI